MAGDDGAVPQAGLAAQPPMIASNAAHTVPVLERCEPRAMHRAMVCSLTQRDRPNAENAGHPPPLTAPPPPPLQDAMEDAALDPMDPLDFGIDLNQITGVSEHGTYLWAETPPPASSPSLPVDFGVVPSEPLRDGMVPAYPGHYLAYPAVAAGPLAPPAGCFDVATAAPRGRRARVAESQQKDDRSRDDILARWREKKARRRAGGGRHVGVQYESRKRTALVKPRLNGKFVTVEVYQRHLVEQAKLGLHMVPTVE